MPDTYGHPVQESPRSRQRPHLRVATAPHRVVDGDPAALIVHDGNCARDGAWNDARGQHDRAGIDRFFGDVQTSGLDRADGHRNTDVGAAPLEHAARHGCQSLVDLGKDTRARLK